MQHRRVFNILITVMPTKKKIKITGPIREEDLSPEARTRLTEYYRLFYLYKMVLSKLRSNREGSTERAHIHAAKDLLLTKEEEQFIKRLDPTSSISKEPMVKAQKKQAWRRPGQNRERKRAS